MLHLVCSKCHKPLPETTCQRESEYLTCPNCQHLVRRSPIKVDDKRWFLARNKKKAGPFTLLQVRKYIAEGKVLPADLAWRPGMARWTRTDALTVLRDDVPPPVAGPETVEGNLENNKQAFTSDTLEENIFLAGGLYVGPGRPVSEFGKSNNVSLDLADFLITKKLGSGGMGSVFQARQKSTGKHVALKILADNLAENPICISRFWQEALILADLDHPNLVRCLGAGQANDVYFIAMEFIEGVSSSCLLKKLGRFTVPDALYITLKCANGLAHVFNRQVIHRDIKPDNILLDRSGAVKITDFGLAKSLEQNFDLTESGVTLGTPRYMPPEQYIDAKNADFRSDIYSLGGVLFHFLTGSCPFEGNSAMEMMLNKEKGPTPSPRKRNCEVPERLDLIVGKMLARDPRRRYQKYEDLITDLTSLGLAGTRLSFNPLRVLAPVGVCGAIEEDALELLFVGVEVESLMQALQALEKKDIANRFHIVKNGYEGIAFLQRAHEFTGVPRPDLIVLGGSVHDDLTCAFLDEIKTNEAWHSIPTVVLSPTRDTLSFLRSHGFDESLVSHQLVDSESFDNLIDSIQGLCVTVQKS